MKTNQAFSTQKSRAKRRNILWDLSYKDWLSIWRLSGKFHLRGRGKGKYCMARFGDKGPYSKTNVFIHEYGANIGDGHRSKQGRKLKVHFSQLPIICHI